MGTDCFEIGGFRVGVRTNSPTMQEIVRRLLASHAVTDEEVAPNYSLLMGGTEGGHGHRRFHFLYADAAVLVRTRDQERLLHGLLSYLSGLATAHRFDGRLHVHAVAVVKDGSALLLPAAARQWLPNLELRLKALGVRVLDSPWTEIDARSGRVVLAPPVFNVDWAALPAFARSLDGEFDVRGWAFPASGDREAGDLARHDAVLWGSLMVLNSAVVGGQIVLDGLATAIRRARTWSVTCATENELAASVRPLLECLS